MTKAILKFDLRSLLIVLIAFIGNGRVLGLDLVLVLILFVSILQLRDPWVIQRRTLSLVFIIVALLLLAALRAPAIDIPYNAHYELWAVKALLLFILVCFGKDLTFPMGNMIALVFICVALILVGRIEGDRLVSVFGPNMLYRIFGFVFFFAVMFNFDSRGGARILLLAFAAFGVYAALLTGSSGGLLVIAIVAVVVVWRFWKNLNLLGRITSIVGTGMLYWIVSSAQQNVMAETRLDSVATFSRLMYKLSVADTNIRFVGWSDLITRPFSMIGQSHAYYSDLWTFGYQYPHNIFLELYAFYGLVGFGLVIVLMTAIYKSIALITRGDIMAMTFVIIVLGANVSGDLSDNYGAIGLAGGILVRSAFRNRSDKVLPKVGVHP